MSEFLTTTQVQELLQVDRTTVYRMLSDGRLSGVKIGHRWRFCKSKIDDLLSKTAPTIEPTPTISFDVLPPTCLQGMQSVSAEAIGIGAIITNATGDPLTQMSNPCRFCKLVNESKKGRAACLEHFSQIAHQAGSTFPQTTYHAGLRLPKIAHNLHRIAIPFVILGVVLSTLHQSSLGGLLLIQGNSLHPLWWTPILPLLFFVSAVSVGLGMIILESSLSSRAFHRGLEIDLLSELAKYIPIGLSIYLLLKFGELAYFGELPYLFSSGGMSALFWLEIIVGAIVPIILFTQAKIRNNANGLLIGSLFVVVGLMINRFNVSWFAVEHIRNLPLAPTFMTQTSYFPSFMEVSVSVGIVAAGVFAFTMAAKYLPLFEGEEETAVHEHTAAIPQIQVQSGD